MPFRNCNWFETCKEGCIPLYLSTILHTSLILVCALCASGEYRSAPSVFTATFGDTQRESMDLETLDDMALNSSLDAPDESESFDIQEGMLEFEHVALSETQVSMQLKSVVMPIKAISKEQANAETSSVSSRKTKLASISQDDVTTRPISFGKRSDFGARQLVLGSGPTLEVVVPGLDPLGSKVLGQAGNLSLTGGAMMVSTACPSSALTDTPLQFSYSASNEDGRRLEIIVGRQTVCLPIYDWELLPLVKFVDSGHNGAVSIQMMGDHDRVSLDAAFEQTLLGLRFIQADLMPRGIIMSQEFLPQNENGVIVGPGEQPRLASDNAVTSAVSELKPLMERTRNGASYSVLTDAGVRFEFKIDGANLAIAGSPYFFFWEPAKKGDRVIPKKALNEELKNAWPIIKQANPLVIESMERCFRTVALFRYQKKKSPADWNTLLKQVNNVSLRAVPTPVFLKK